MDRVPPHPGDRSARWSHGHHARAPRRAYRALDPGAPPMTRERLLYSPPAGTRASSRRGPEGPTADHVGAIARPSHDFSGRGLMTYRVIQIATGTVGKESL